MPSASDFVEGSVWYSPSYSGYVWLVLSSQMTASLEDPESYGMCLILGQDHEREFSFTIGSVAQWDSLLAWCKSSVRIA
jgi:hypothetical protein